MRIISFASSFTSFFISSFISFISLSLLTTLLFIPATYATRYPTFVAPDKTLLLSLGLLDTASCSKGQAKLAPHALINIKQHTCKTFCPGYWHWVGSSLDTCHDLTTQFDLKHYDIHHYINQDGTTNYSVVTAIYGAKNQPYYSFAFTLMTLVGEYWQCFLVNSSPTTLSCANDI